jgi:urease accessory protein UreF
MNEEALAHLARLEEISFPAAFAFAAAQRKVPAQPAVVAYIWAWLEGQVTAPAQPIAFQRLPWRMVTGTEVRAERARAMG